MQKLLSVVVPVYKVEKYINKCLDSLILDNPQLMSLLEVVVVNDGTPDNSAEMSREYVKRYPETFRQAFLKLLIFQRVCLAAMPRLQK